MVKKLLLHLRNAALLTLLFLLPDLIYMLVNPNYFYWRPAILKEIAALYQLSFLILAVQRFWVRYLFALFIVLLSFAQLFHFSYFHSYIMPYEIGLIDQVAEMADTLSGVFHYTLLPVAVFVAQLIVLYFFLRKAEAFRIKFIPILIILILLIGPISAHKRKRAYVYLPKSTSFSFKNTYAALSWYLGKYAFAHQKHHHFKPYKVIETNDTLPKNIIVIMGESLTSKKMSLFGYPKESTPNLDRLRDKPNFRYTWGISSGVTTDVSIPTFFTLKREPQNTTPLITNSTNLLRLAKQHGYTTHYVTTQSLFLISGVLADFADHKEVYKGYDQLLVDYLKSVDFNKSNFIVLHQRNSHSPYERYTPPKFHYYPYKDLPYHDYMLATYLNSIRYTDYIVNEVFKKVDALPECSVVFFTSDHGEMTGEKEEGGRYGHAYLGFADTQVPLIIYYNRACPKEVTKKFDLTKVISHYQFGTIIANTLGYKIINPNEDGSYYVNGVDIAGGKGFLRYRDKFEAIKRKQ